MKKLAFTTAVALALATSAYAADHHGGGGMGGGMGGGGSMSAHAPSMGGGGGPSPSFSAPRASSGPSSSTRPTGGPTGNLYNHAPTTNSYNKSNGGNFTRDRDRFSDRDRHLYNRADRDRDFDHGDRDRHMGGDRDFRQRGIVRGDFFEHGRHFHFRRFWQGEWVFLTAYDDCTAWAWVNVGPGTWAWSPVDICVG
jgi:opacity protein-like surface antigen